ncbi:phenylacetate--CoA ligase family protein [Cryptosporangium sp. NPDC048952]|uniref:phenylacetate--CoA ligase family protein n=1 Tax=Cryptosporangium sp. NPDC048952 TaxID=3363961 RepID=UPI00371B6C85
MFHNAAEQVPAYGHFLDARGVDPDRVRTLDDFRSVPPVTKENYVRAYPLPERCRGGTLDGCDTVALSSGSSGQPTVWPRRLVDELAATERFAEIFRTFGADQYRTLAVICFPLGNWVGGMFTAAACRHLTTQGFRLTVATPGNVVDEILRVIDALGPFYDQVVLLGYPPFVKNVIDRGSGWPARKLKLVFAGEVFSERWRDLIAERAGIADPIAHTAALYGTADAGVLGIETPRTVRLRRELSGTTFGGGRVPTLVEYDPEHRYFETDGGALLFTADGAVPLIRYDIGDEGGLLPDNVVYVYGRSLFAVSLYGANVYPENVAEALEADDIVGWTTGRFVLRTPENGNGDRLLDITVELAPGFAGEGREALVAEAIRAHVPRVNSEFAHYVPADRQLPTVRFRPVGDPDNFPVGVKHRYSR